MWSVRSYGISGRYLLVHLNEVLVILWSRISNCAVTVGRQASLKWSGAAQWPVRTVRVRRGVCERGD